MVSAKERLHDLVDRLPDERAEQALAFLEQWTNEQEDGHDGVVWEGRATPPVVSWRGFAAQPSRAWQQFAAEQDVTPVERFEDLLGDGGPEVESVDDMIETIRAWRREDGRA